MLTCDTTKMCSSIITFSLYLRFKLSFPLRCLCQTEEEMRMCEQTKQLVHVLCVWVQQMLETKWNEWKLTFITDWEKSIAQCDCSEWFWDTLSQRVRQNSALTSAWPTSYTRSLTTTAMGNQHLWYRFHPLDLWMWLSLCFTFVHPYMICECGCHSVLVLFILWLVYLIWSLAVDWE